MLDSEQKEHRGRTDQDYEVADLVCSVRGNSTNPDTRGAVGEVEEALEQLSAIRTSERDPGVR